MEIVRDGMAAPALGAKSRLLLGMLIANANHVVSLDGLVDGLWPDGPPTTAEHVVQNCISQLRKLVEADRAKPQVLVRTDPGYRLVVGPDDVDSRRFERLLGDGRAALQSGEPARAAQQLVIALALWRGPALAGMADEVAVRAEAQRLDHLRVLATEDRIEAQVMLGQHGQLISELEGLVEES